MPTALTPHKASKDFLASAAYQKLISEIIQIYQSARKTLAAAYWQIGKRIVEIEQHGSTRAEYGKGILKKMSKELKAKCGPGFSEDNLQRMRRFYLESPKYAAPRILDWTAQVELLRIEDKAVRERLGKKAADQGLSSRQIRELIRAETSRNQGKKNRAGDGIERLPFVCLGPLYTYPVIRESANHDGKRELLLDLGFSQTIEWSYLLALRNLTLKAGTRFSEGAIVSSTKDSRGILTLAKVPSLPGRQAGATPDLLYTYKAYVERVLDGDTLEVDIRLGFGQRRGETIRLKGIDAPELDTPEGEAAKKFVEDQLKGIDFIILKSTRTQKEKWGRYLGDIFLPPRNVYLNQLLLDRGHARRLV